MGYCKACDRLVKIVPTPPDPQGRPRARVLPHELPDGRICTGEGKTL